MFAISRPSAVYKSAVYKVNIYQVILMISKASEISHLTSVKLAMYGTHVNTLRPRQNGRLFADDIFKCLFLHEDVWISIKNSLKFVAKGPINNIAA